MGHRLRYEVSSDTCLLLEFRFSDCVQPLRALSRSHGTDSQRPSIYTPPPSVDGKQLHLWNC
jgi:hypothetical protein